MMWLARILMLFGMAIAVMLITPVVFLMAGVNLIKDGRMEI
jgi:hypothetical protein